MSLEASTSAETGPLSMSDAVSLLTAEPEEVGEGAALPEAGAGGEAQQDEADDQAASEDDAPGDDDPASEDASEDDDGDDEPATAIEAPKFWSAEDKATFALAPPEVQKVIAERFTEAEARVYAAKEDAAEARKEASIIVQAREAVDQLLGRAEQLFQGKWDGVDWAQWAKDAPDEAFAAKMEFDAEQETLAQLRTAQAATEGEEYRQFIRAESAKLAERVPELADPKEGVARKRELLGYLTDEGFAPEDLKWAGANELTVAFKAMMWDRTKANLSRRPTNAPVAQPKGPGSARPTAAAPPRKSNLQRRKAEAVGRVMQSGKMADGIAALVALEG